MDLRINGINVHFEIIGTGKPILLLHGVGLDHTIWKSMAEMYASQAQFILPICVDKGGQNWETRTTRSNKWLKIFGSCWIICR